MKELFESAELEVMILSDDDIITTSVGIDPISGEEEMPGGGNAGDLPLS